jgi:dCTP deaminase
MILKAEVIADYIKRGEKSQTKDPLVISPSPDPAKFATSGSASIDLRLGTWFVKLRQARVAALRFKADVSQSQLPEPQLIETHYVPFGDEYYLHPQAFVLGITLEWIRLPSNLAAYVIGKSSLGRRGLIIATATGVHPGFKGCLTLELGNLGETPIAITPGIKICQIFLHEVRTRNRELVDQSQFGGSRKPRLGEVRLEDDEIVYKLATARMGVCTK